MGGTESRMKAPVFLKSGTATLDVNAQGALGSFLVCETKDTVSADQAIKPSHIKILNHDTWEFTKVTGDQWAEFKDFVVQHPATTVDDAAAVDEELEARLAPYIFNPCIAAEYRDHIKESTAHKTILLLSLVVSPSNIKGWVDAQSGDAAAKRIVKVTEKTIKTEGNQWGSYTRLVCQPSHGIVRSSAPCSFHRALMQLSTADGVHCGFTQCNGVMVDEKTGDVLEGPFTQDEYQRVCEIFEQGCRGDVDAATDMISLCTEVLNKTDAESSLSCEGTDRFVVLLTSERNGRNKISVQLESSLNEDTIDKIVKSKEKIPTSTHNARKMCDKQGSLLKHATAVHLSIADFEMGYKKAAISTHKYE